MTSTRVLGPYTVPAIGLGCMPLSGMPPTKDWILKERGTAIGVIQAALDAGVRLLDTSDIYATVGNDMGVSANSATAIAAVRDLSDSINIRNSLSHYGVKQEVIGDIAKTVLADSVTGNNPIAPTEGEVQGILTSRL